MLIRHKKGWELRESEVTPEAVFHRRRDLLKAVAAGSILAPGLLSSLAAAAGEDPSAELYPAKQNPRYVLDRPLTDEKLATSYNNFYEFGSQKSIASAAQALKIRPWTIKIDGLVDKPMTVDIDDLLKEDAARGKALPPPLRRGLVDGGAVERLPNGRLRRFRKAAGLGEICPIGHLSRPPDRARPE